MIILVVYFGDKEWEGARTLHELIDWSGIPDKWKSMFVDYQMHLLEVNKIENLDQYHSDLMLLFGILKYRKDKKKMEAFIEKNKEAFSDVSADLVKVIREYSHSKELLNMITEKKNEHGKETVDMCQAFREMIEEGREEGREQFGELVLCLLEVNRTDDLKKVSKDPVYREKLLQEYGIAG